MRGRKPKPTHLKVVGGNAGKRPINDAEPPGRGEVGVAPKGWTREQAAIWTEIVDQAPEGVLTGSDRLLVELTCRLLATVRADPAAPAAVYTQLKACLAEAGMSPASRARLTVPKPAANPFAGLDA